MNWIRALLFVVILIAAAVELKPRVENPIDHSWLVKAVEDTGPATFVMLGSASRQNEVRVPARWRSLRMRSLVTELNAGIHTASKSSIAVDDSGLYVGSDSGAFHAFDFEGRPRWTLKAPMADRGFHGTATMDARAVYVGDYQGYLWALDKSTGDLRWQTKLGDAIGTAPLIDGPDLLVSSEFARSGADGMISRVRRADGALVWQSHRFNAQTHSSPTLSGPVVAFGDNGGRMFGLGSKDGMPLWFFEAGGAIKNPPLAIDGAFIFGSWSRALFKVDALKGSLIWKHDVGGRVQSSPVFISSTNEVMIISRDPDPHVTFVDFKSGHVSWQGRHEANARNGYSTPLLLTSPGHQQILFPCRGRELCLMNARTKKIEARVELPGEFSGVPAFHLGKIYLALDQGGIVEVSAGP